MLSVVIPVYNVEQYLEKCLVSVLNQTYNNLEIILINDGSLDNSGKICEKYAQIDKRIRYVDKENEGSGATRNLGISIAKGEYITFLDSDDWWDCKYAELMMQAAKKADIAVCDLMYVDIDEEGRPCSKISSIRIKDDEVVSIERDADIINKARTFLCGKVFKTELFRKNHITQPSMAINDFPIVCLLIAKANTICRVGKPLYYYLRGRAGNTVTSFSALFSFKVALEELHNNFVKNNLFADYEMALHKMYYSQIRFALRKGLIASKTEKKEEYQRLYNELYDFLKDNWKNMPDVFGKTFTALDNDVITQGIKNVIIDDNQLVSDIRLADYIIVEKGKAYKTEKNIIEIEVNYELTGEDLYWDIADKILFSIPS